MSPIYRQNIYVGVSEKLKKHETPIDFFNVDTVKFPHAEQAKILSLTLNAGDCFYVPAYYYI